MSKKQIEFSWRLCAAELPELVELVGQAWSFDEYSSEAARHAAKEKYLLEHLEGCTTFISAKINGQTAGFIAGRIPGVDKTVFDASIKELADEAACRLESSSTFQEREHWRRGWMCASDWYDERIKCLGQSSALSSWIDLFIVGSSARGSGVGGRLFNLFEDAAEKSGAGRGIMLKTDSWCSWGFYEKKGFTRLAEFACGEELEGGAYYLYGKGIE